MMADGCFDPLHVGHLRYLAAAADLGGELVVNVAPDDVIRAKGRTPFQNANERIAMMRSVAGVSAVFHGDLATRIKLHRPKYLVKGIEWSGRLPEDVIGACRSAGTTIIYTDTQERTSTERLADDRR